MPLLDIRPRCAAAHVPRQDQRTDGRGAKRRTLSERGEVRSLISAGAGGREGIALPSFGSARTSVGMQHRGAAADRQTPSVLRNPTTSPPPAPLNQTLPVSQPGNQSENEN